MNEIFQPYRDRVDENLKRFLSLKEIPAPLREAMIYGVFNGGKRIRPLLVYMALDAFDGDIAHADATASAIEMIHAYSLIHDDLPAMDDDDLRRGNPTVHIKYDEATAILAGDALQARAIELIADDESISAETRIALIKLITHAIGPAGMVAGQSIDLAAENKTISESELVNMHRRKTGDLISASVMSGALIAGVDDEMTQCFSRFGYALGLAFQVRDDILDETGDTNVMGKAKGSDQSNNKATFTSSHGLDYATAQLDSLHQQAIDALSPLGSNAQPLIMLANFVATRDH